MNFYYWFSTFQHVLSFGYSCFMPLLLACWLVLKSYQLKTVQFISITNRWFWVYALLFTVYWIYSLIYTIYFFQKLSSDSGPVYIDTSSHFLQFLTVPFVFLFISNKRRKSVLFSLFALAALFISSSWFERIIVYLTSFYQDYLPSKWSILPTVWWQSNAFTLFLYLILITATYLIQQKRNKPVSSH